MTALGETDTGALIRVRGRGVVQRTPLRQLEAACRDDRRTMRLSILKSGAVSKR